MKNLINLYWPAIIVSKDINRERITTAIKGVFSYEAEGDMKCLIHMIFCLCETTKSKTIGYNDNIVYQRMSVTANLINTYIDDVCHFLLT